MTRWADPIAFIRERPFASCCNSRWSGNNAAGWSELVEQACPSAELQLLTTVAVPEGAAADPQ